MSILFRFFRQFLKAAGPVLAAVLLFPGFVQGGQGTVVVESFRVKPYEEALRGFRDTVPGGVRKVVYADSDPSVAKTVRKESPELVLAIGRDALEKVRSIRDIPIVYCMVLNPGELVGGQENVTGVSMEIPPDRQLASLRKIVPSARKVGLLYDPAGNGAYFRKALHAAQTVGVDLVAQEVRTPRDIHAALARLKEAGIGAFWMIPDKAVLTPETEEHIMLFWHKEGIPVLAVSEKYVEMGALAAVVLDAVAIGRQTGEIALQIMGGTRPAGIPRIDGGNTKLAVNAKVAKKLGITLGSEILSTARIIQ